MDLLEQYNKQFPEASREQKRPPLMDEYGRTYTGMIAVAMRLSGGRITDARMAIYALLGVVAVIAIIAVILFFRLLGIGTGPNRSEIIPVAGPGNESLR